MAKKRKFKHTVADDPMVLSEAAARAGEEAFGRPADVNTTATNSEKSPTRAISRAVMVQILRRLAAAWGLASDQLLDSVGIRSEDSGPLDDATLEHISHLLNIFGDLHRLFGDHEYADRWIRSANDAFGGRPPSALLLGGSLAEIKKIRRYLDNALSS
jgi:hypothetical protein